MIGLTTLILIRHGESESNIIHIFNGQGNVQLTKKGHEQAKKTAEYVTAKFKIDKIYSSDLDRAYNTAKYISDITGLPITKKKGLREIFAGDWEGKDYKYIEEHYPEDYKAWREDIGNTKCFGGESILELAERFSKAVLEIAEENDGKTVVIAAHSAPLRAMRCVFAEEPLSKMQEYNWLNNASVSVVEFKDGKYEIKLWAEDSHLAEINAKYQ